MQFLDFNFLTTFYIIKIKDEHRIMSQAMNKEVGLSSQQHFQSLSCLMPLRFHCVKDLTYYNLKLRLNQFDFSSVWIG